MASLLRRRGAPQRVTNAELFFDLVYVFAITQLSHSLIAHPSVGSAIQTLILLGLVWEAWAYTTWMTNWLDPDRIPVRAMLFAIAFASLVMSLSIPEAFSDRGWALAGAYAAMHIGREVFAIYGVSDDPSLKRNYERILVWCVVSSAVALAGAAVDGHAREVLWALVVLIDVMGGLTGYYTPGLGRSSTTEWTIDGAHFAERCHAFVLIALGESVLVLGATLSGIDHVGSTEMLVFGFGFLGVIGLWWIYFGDSAERAAELFATAEDPGRVGRAYHEIHLVLIGGVIVVAAAVELVLHHPYHASPATTWTVLGGTALFIGGHAAFTAYLLRVRPWSRIIAVLVLIALLPVGPHVSPIVLSMCAVAVTVAVAVSDFVQQRASVEEAHAV